MRVEFKSRTATLPLDKLGMEVLKVRAKGIKAVRKAIEQESKKGSPEARSTARKLIASMNFSVYQVKRQLQFQEQ